MQGSILFPPAATPSNDGQFPGSFSLPDGGANVATPGNVKTPGGTDAWGAGTMFGRQTPGRGGFGAEGTPAAASGTTPYANPRSAGRTPSRPISLLLHDVATPNAQPRGEYHSSRTPGGGSSNLWSRSTSGAAPPPPPPVETLGDFIDRTPEAATPPPQQAFSPGTYGSSPGGGMYGSPPTMGGFMPQGGFASQGGFAQQGSGLWNASSGHQSWPPAPLPDQWQHPPQSPGGVPAAANQTPWRTLSFGGGAASPERSPMADSPVSGVVHSGALLTVPQLRPMEGLPQAGRSSEDDRWVTVYGFGPDDTNLVLREFERCGPIVEHVFGPRGSNWMHLQYQNMYDARKALAKNSAQLTGSLIIGVKPLDPQLRASITRKAEDSQTGQQNGVASPLSKTVFGPGPRTPAPAYRPYHLEPIDGKPTGIAQPSKSTLTKVLDFLFSA